MACREIDLIVIRCSTTRADRRFTEYDLEAAHRHRGFNGYGYHFYIHKNGDIKITRPVRQIGAHARDCNTRSIDIYYESGLDKKGRPADTHAGWQRHSLHVLVRTLLLDCPGCHICEHRDLNPGLNGNGEIEPEEWVKQCPCFEVSKEQW